ncbi:HD domain-containing protein [Gemmatimonadota bacterium]
MLVHTDHLVSGMTLERDIELKAGSYLITRRELGDGCLNDKVIESVQKFSGQITPESNRVLIKDDKFALGYLKKIVDEDLYRVARSVTTEKGYPNFLSDVDIHEKVMRVMEMIFSNPDIIRTMYDTKFNSDGQAESLDSIFDHSIRTSLLVVALGLRLRCTIISLICLGIAALLHDMGIFATEAFPDLKSIDEMSPEALKAFIEQHQIHGEKLLYKRRLTISPFQRNEILQIVASHHKSGLEGNTHKNTLLFHFADLLDEMVSHLPHGIRYNFTPDQIEKLGKQYGRRNGLVNVLLGLARLYKGQGGQCWGIISNLAGLFKMEELLAGDFREKLQEIIDFCPFNCARTNPPLDGNLLPRTIFCGNSTDEDFSCEHLVFIKVKVQDQGGHLIKYHKCGTLGDRLQEYFQRDSD